MFVLHVVKWVCDVFLFLRLHLCVGFMFLWLFYMCLHLFSCVRMKLRSGAHRIMQYRGCFGLLGAPRGRVKEALRFSETSWRVLEPFWGRLAAVLTPSWAVLGPSWSRVGAVWVPCWASYGPPWELKMELF